MKKRVSSLGKCPACGDEIVARSGFYGCNGYKDGCSFTLSFNALASIGHPNITAAQMRALLKGAAKMEFKTANGVERIFSVELKEIDGKWRAWIDFDAGSELESLGECPLCGADVVESMLSFCCSKWREGCEFAIFKNSIKRFGGKMVTKQKAIELLKSGQTRVSIKGLNGSRRDVTLLLDEEFGCKVVF